MALIGVYPEAHTPLWIIVRG